MPGLTSKSKDRGWQWDKELPQERWRFVRRAGREGKKGKKTYKDKLRAKTPAVKHGWGIS